MGFLGMWWLIFTGGEEYSFSTIPINFRHAYQNIIHTIAVDITIHT